MRTQKCRNGRTWMFGRAYEEWLLIDFGYDPSVKFMVELPSTWHDESPKARGTLRMSLWKFHITVDFPWYKKYEDHMQCSGPRFGFQFYEEWLWIRYGNDDGHSKNMWKHSLSFIMPWGWKHKDSAYIADDPEGPYQYQYRLKSGDVQHVEATIYKTHREWYRFWYPWHMESDSIMVDFSDEIGERTGSWKGGVTGCSYKMLPDETPLMTLARMERERKFD